MNKNTVEEFKSMDKTALLNSVGEVLWANVKDKGWIEKPGSLLNFLILSFAVSGYNIILSLALHVLCSSLGFR